MARVVVVTGASAGLGRAIALEFAKEGDKVAILARDKKRLASLKKEIEGMGSDALSIALDVADSNAVHKAAEKVESELGPIDVWVNNAMVTIFSEVKDLTPEEYKRVTEVTYLGTVNGTMAALNHMIPRNKGRIIQVGSALAYRAIPMQSAYCGGKHAIQGFSESLRSELIHNNKKITVTMIQMPALNTPQFDWGRVKIDKEPMPVPPIYQPEVAAEAVVWASHHDEREFVVGGKNQMIVWLNKFFPGFGDWYLAKHYDDQKTDRPKENRGDNLFKTVKGEYGARGSFGEQAKDSSKWFLIYKNRRMVWLALISIFLIILALLI